MASDPTSGWARDAALGSPFVVRTLPLGEDAEGPVVATLVQYRPGGATPTAHRGDVLYVHGWSDYFFQRHVAQFWHRHGWRFHALDLRKYGRSLRPGQTPGLVADLADYDADIAAALDAIGCGGKSSRPLLLHGVSTGALTLATWADRHDGAAAGLVLSSPWLEFQANAAGRIALAPALRLQARRNPTAELPQVDRGFYSRTMSAQLDGEWDYNRAWRPDRGFTVNPVWLKAILAGHERVADGLQVTAPVLTLLSTRSMLSPLFSPEMARVDVAIDVDVTAARAVRLGPVVTVVRIEDAVHDVFLSAPPVRKRAFEAVTRWLSGYDPVD